VIDSRNLLGKQHATTVIHKLQIPGHLVKEPGAFVGPNGCAGVSTTMESTKAWIMGKNK
jgi:hypothetical protein